LVLDDFPKWHEMNGEYFCDVVLEEARWAVMPITEKSGTEEVMIRMDNCTVHNSAKTTKRSEELQVTRLPQRPYHPDISLCDFCFLGWSRDVMHGQNVRGQDNARACSLDLWHNLDPSMLVSVYHDWVERLEHAIAMNWDDNSK
jgi:hypothetical protein